LAWCQQRLNELQGQTSLLNPVWFVGALTMGMCAGLTSDKISLSFLAETEHQVAAHLQKHLDESLPKQDLKSRAIVSQMQQDEKQHAQTANDLGATELPFFIRQGMKFAAKIMTTVAHRI